MCVCDTHTRLMNLHCDSLRRLEEGTRRHKAENKWLRGYPARMYEVAAQQDNMYKYIANTITH